MGIALPLWIWCVNNGEFGFGLTILGVGWMADNVCAPSAVRDNVQY